MKARKQRKQDIFEELKERRREWVRRRTRWAGPEHKEPVLMEVFSDNPRGTKGLRAAVVIGPPY